MTKLNIQTKMTKSISQRMIISAGLGCSILKIYYPSQLHKVKNILSGIFLMLKDFFGHKNNVIIFRNTYMDELFNLTKIYSVYSIYNGM